MTTPAFPTSPGTRLGGLPEDIGGGVSSFIQGLIGQRQRMAQLALQQALGQAQVQRLGAETELSGAQKALAEAQAGRERALTGQTGALTQELQHQLLPAGNDQFLRLQAISPGAKPSELEGMNRGEAEKYIDSATMRAMMLQGRILPMTTPSGQQMLVQPFAPGGMQTTMVPGAGRPVTEQQTRQAGLGLAAESANNDLTRIENTSPQVLSEVSLALQGPSLARLAPFIGSGMEEALTQLRMLGLSPSAQEYVKRLYDYASLVAPDRYGRQFRNPAILHQAWTDFGAGQFGLGPQGIQATQRNRFNGVATLKSAAGPQALQQSQQYFTPSQAPAVQGAPSPTQVPTGDPYSQWDH